MKTTIDLPDLLFRKVKATAAAEGVSLKSFITKALEHRLNTGSRPLAAVLGDLPIGMPLCVRFWGRLNELCYPW